VVHFNVDTSDVDFPIRVIEQCSQYIVQATMLDEPLEPIYESYLALWRRWDEESAVSGYQR
jgi:hypothetical protein